MKSIWKYICIGLIVALIGMFTISMNTQNKLKDRIIELQENIPDTTFVEIIDTVYFDKPVVKWKTRTEYDTVTTSDTLWCDSIVVVNNYIERPIDTFSVEISKEDSVLDATINIEGRGVFDKTFIDGVRMDYKIHTEVLIPKKKCNWWKRFWCGCE